MLQKRKLEGCLCRVPNRFYNQVWDILRRTPKGIRFRNQVMPQQPTINNMTHSELQFALYVESMLNQLEMPEYRQLIVEVTIILIIINILSPIYMDYNLRVIPSPSPNLSVILTIIVTYVRAYKIQNNMTATHARMAVSIVVFLFFKSKLSNS